MSRGEYDAEEEIKQGQVFTWSCTIFDDYAKKLIRNLTGWTGVFEVRSERGGSVLFTHPVVLGAAEEWHVKLTVPDSETQKLVSPDGARTWEAVGQLSLLNSSGQKEVRIDFRLLAIADITGN